MNDGPAKPEDDEKIENSSNDASGEPKNTYVGSGLLLFVDQLLVAAAGWIYWLVISRFASTSEIGHATTIYSLVLLTTMITQLGLEYPLLRRSQEQRSKIFGTVIALEMALTAVSIPLVLLVVNSLYQVSVQEFAFLAIGILVFTSFGFVMRFALLGISDAKNVLIFDVIGNVVKFASGFILVWAGFGTFAILISFLAQAILIAAGTFLIARRSFRLSLGDLTYAKGIIRDALTNMPSKLSRTFIMSLSVILLASLGISSSDVGVFYIAVMVSIAAGGFASSMAYMVIPASSASKKDLSVGSLRLGLSFTAPIIVALIAAPEAILSIIGSEYVSAQTILIVLAIGILPSVVVNNSISSLNNLGKSKELIAIGSTQLVSFVLAFYALVPQLGTLGAALSMLIAFVASGVLAGISSDRASARYIVGAIIAVAVAGAIGYVISNVLGGHPAIAIVVSILVSVGVILAVKNTSVKEVKQLIASLR